MRRKKKSFTQKLADLLHKFTRFTKEQKGFIVYLAILVFFIVFFPIIKVSGIVEGEGYAIWLLGKTFVKTAVFIFLILIVLVGWNTSFRFKNFMIRYLSFRNDDNLINFFLLWVIVLSFLGITDTLSVINGVTSRISLTIWANIIQIILLIGLIQNLWLVIRDTKNNSKKAKIITIQDSEEDHELKEKDKEQLRGLFTTDDKK